jgi:biopolymer transport protein ExbD
MAIRHGGLNRKSKVASEIPDSSLADIAFLLLIFFMVTTVFRSERERDVTMPDAAATERVDEKRKNVVHLWVEADGSLYMNDQQVPMQNVRTIAARLYEETNQRLVVAIRADRAVPYSVINDITEELRAASAVRVNFATEFEQRVTRARR